MCDFSLVPTIDDALEFPDGKIVLLTTLKPGQQATFSNFQPNLRRPKRNQALTPPGNVI
jgi:hypothetical protein